MMAMVKEKPDLSLGEFQLFRVFIEQECGIVLADDKSYLLESRIRHLLDTYQCQHYGELYRKLSAGTVPDLKNQLIDSITTNETLWFRDQGPFVIMDEIFLPKVESLVAAGKPKIRIWCAATSTGQEPYSLAMVINDYCTRKAGVLNPYHFEILATDISKKALSAARLGVYDQHAMNRGLPPEYREKYFKESNERWVIDPSLKKMINFQEFNLQDDFTHKGPFDAIFCRNVAIYFSPEFKLNMFQNMYKTLSRGGLFFLGTSETLAYFKTDFQSLEHKNHTYYVS